MAAIGAGSFGGVGPEAADDPRCSSPRIIVDKRLSCPQKELPLDAVRGDRARAPLGRARIEREGSPVANEARELPLVEGWRPGVIGEVVSLQARYYARHWSFGSYFEAKLAAEAAAFVRRYDPRVDLLLSAWDGERVVGSVTIDGGDPERPEDLAHLRWFIVDDGFRGRGLGRRLVSRSLEFARRTGRSGVYLWTFAGLDAARRLYDAEGFRLVREVSGDTWGTRVTEQRFELRFGGRC